MGFQKMINSHDVQLVNCVHAALDNIKQNHRMIWHSRALNDILVWLAIIRCVGLIIRHKDIK